MELTCKQLQNLLKEKGIMQKDIAGSENVTQGHLSQVFHGKRESKRIMKIVSKILGFEVKLIFDEKRE